jgi:predicted deacetylase
MTPARYLFRMDDVTPTMNWEKFTALLALFRRFEVKPLLGIVPDNRDPKLRVKPPRPDFWKAIQALAQRGEVEIAQHGYQHILSSHGDTALINSRYGLRTRSEFAGLSYDEQIDKIRNGRTFLQGHGIETSSWMAPNHSFDRTTLRALKDSGFTALTDGISLFPFKEEGIICIPQQLWKPTWMPTGTLTICLHSDETTIEEIARIRHFLSLRPLLTSFSAEVTRYRERNVAEELMDRSFRTMYVGARKIRRRRSTGVQVPSRRSGPRGMALGT